MTNYAEKIDIGLLTESFDRPEGKIVMGIDGFIDEVWQIIGSRISREEYRLFEKLTDFSKALSASEEGGFTNEIVRKRRTYGGFVANTGKAVFRLGVRPVLLGMFGQDGIDSVFSEFEEFTELVPVGDPGICQIFEFTDGKIMLPFIQEVLSFDWHALTKVIDEKALKTMFADAAVIALGYWTLMPAFDEIVTRICEMLKGIPGKRRMFFDFADIRKSERSSLENSLGKLAGLNEQIPMTLSLNEHEAGHLFSFYGETFDAQDPEGADAMTERVRNALGLDELIAHTPYYAAAASVSEGSCVAIQNYCTSPVITTGAGDNFNGGYMVAMLKGMSLSERLTIGNAVTYLYVSGGHCPYKDELFALLEKA